jgi:hypothetical protein
MPAAIRFTVVWLNVTGKLRQIHKETKECGYPDFKQYPAYLFLIPACDDPGSLSERIFEAIPTNSAMSE